MLARIRSASVPAKLSELHLSGEGLSVGEHHAKPPPQVKPVPLTRVKSLTRICEDQQELLACSDSVPEDVPNWVLAMRKGMESGKSSLFAGKRVPRDKSAPLPPATLPPMDTARSPRQIRPRSTRRMR